MAQRVEVILIDDLDGGKATETLQFALDGTAYEIDLSAKNASALRSDLDKWIQHGRRSSAARRGSSGSSRPTRRQDLAKIREWARANGHQVSDRGRVAADIQKAYDEAN